MAEDITIIVENEVITIEEVGTPGATGASSYTYIAYASDSSGTNFTTTFDSSLDYIAFLRTTTEITTPQASDFEGLWYAMKTAPVVGTFDETEETTDGYDRVTWDSSVITIEHDLGTKHIICQLSNENDVPVLLSPSEVTTTTISFDLSDSILDVASGWSFLITTGGIGPAPSGVYEPVQTAASQVEMEAGTETSLRSMSPLRVAQAIAELAGTGSGDVTAASDFGTDNVLVKSDGAGKGTQATGIAVDDSNNVSGIAQLTASSVVMAISSPRTPANTGRAITSADFGKTLTVTAETDQTFTSPDSETSPDGAEVFFIAYGVGDMVLNRAGTDTVDLTTGITMTSKRKRYRVTNCVAETNWEIESIGDWE